MNITRKPILGYPHPGLAAIVLAISLTALVGLALQPKVYVANGIAHLLATCDHCGSTQVTNSTSTLN